MLLNYIRSNRASYIALLPLVAIALWLQTFLSGQISSLAIDAHPMPLYYLLEIFLKDYPFFYNLPAFVLILGMAFLILRINEKFMIIETRSYLVAMLLIVLQSSVLPLNRLHPGLIAAIFMLFAIDKLFDTYKDESQFTNFFDAGILLSVGSLFYFSTLYFIVALWVGMVVFGNFSLRNWLLGLTGLLLPYFLSWSYFYISDDVAWFRGTIGSNFFLDNKTISLNIADYVFFMFLLIMIVLASYKVVSQMQVSKISSRKYMRFFFGFFAISLILFFFAPSASVELLPIMAIPISFLLSYYFIVKRSHWLGNILIVVFIILILGMQLFPVVFKLAI